MSNLMRSQIKREKLTAYITLQTNVDIWTLFKRSLHYSPSSTKRMARNQLLLLKTVSHSPVTRSHKETKWQMGSALTLRLSGIHRYGGWHNQHKRTVFCWWAFAYFSVVQNIYWIYTPLFYLYYMSRELKRVLVFIISFLHFLPFVCFRKLLIKSCPCGRVKMKG